MVLYEKKFKKCPGGFDINIATDVWIEYPNNIEIGENCGINKGSWINGLGGITIGDNVIIGPYVVIHSANHRFEHSGVPFKNQGYPHKKVSIKDNVWIGAHTIILPGVSIGSHVVIGAGSIVADDVPDNSVVIGQKARVVRTL